MLEIIIGVIMGVLLFFVPRLINYIKLKKFEKQAKKEIDEVLKYD